MFFFKSKNNDDNKEFKKFLTEKQSLTKEITLFNQDLTAELAVVQTLNKEMLKLKDFFVRFSNVNDLDFSEPMRLKLLKELDEQLLTIESSLQTNLKNTNVKLKWIFDQELKTRIHNMKFLISSFSIDKWTTNPEKVVNKIYINYTYNAEVKSSRYDIETAAELYEAYEKVLNFNHELSKLVNDIETKNGKYSVLLNLNINDISEKKSNKNVNITTYLQKLKDFLEKTNYREFLHNQTSIRNILATEHFFLQTCAEQIKRCAALLEIYVEFLSKEEAFLTEYKHNFDILEIASNNLHQKVDAMIQSAK